MEDTVLMYRACGAECREDWLRMLANDNGLPLETVMDAADRLGSTEDFGQLVELCEGREGVLS